MRHAILIIGHKNFHHVLGEVARYDADFTIFIHWDKRHPLFRDQREALLSTGRVAYIGEELCVNWASYGIVRATLLLCEKAFEYGMFDYFHLISDADVLTADVRKFKTFFVQNNGRSFLHYAPLNETSEGIYKLKYFHRMEKYNIRGSQEDKVKYHEDLKSQQDAGCERELPPGKLYWGSAWWSLRHDCVKYLLEQKVFIERYFVDTLFPDEHFVQVVIMNSPLAKTVENRHLRYISWIYRNGNSPAVLDRSDLPSIMTGNYFYARKIDEKISRELVGMLNIVYPHNFSLNGVECMSLREVIINVLQLVDGFPGGLMYGVGGALVFLSQCYKAGLEPTLVNLSCIRKVQNKVFEEIRSVRDESWQTGSLGLRVALKYSENIVPIVLPLEFEESLSDMEETVVNRVLNSVESLEGEEQKYCFALLQTLANTRSSDVLSQVVLAAIGTSPILKMSLDEKNISHAHAGLLGVSGLGLLKMTQKGLLSSREWTYLL